EPRGIVGTRFTRLLPRQSRGVLNFVSSSARKWKRVLFHFPRSTSPIKNPCLFLSRTRTERLVLSPDFLQQVACQIEDIHHDTKEADQGSDTCRYESGRFVQRQWPLPASGMSQNLQWIAENEIDHKRHY
ncbi:MAG TPA: hypothetical protein VJH63_00170, partial [Candidatus Paceibacterota bacterium]